MHLGFPVTLREAWATEPDGRAQPTCRSRAGQETEEQWDPRAPGQKPEPVHQTLPLLPTPRISCFQVRGDVDGETELRKKKPSLPATLDKGQPPHTFLTRLLSTYYVPQTCEDEPLPAPAGGWRHSQELRAEMVPECSLVRWELSETVDVCPGTRPSF